LESDRNEHAARAQAVKRLHTRYERIQARTETMYLDKLDGCITQEFFDKQAGQMRSEQDALLRKIQDIQKAAPTPVDQAIDMMGFMSRASALFLEQPAAEQRRLLQVVVDKADWKNGTLRTSLVEPFEILRHSNRESSRKENENEGSGRDLEVGSSGRIRTYNPSVNSHTGPTDNNCLASC
jgi:site-specific DNA recombinase